jgi:hypothetical protein
VNEKKPAVSNARFFIIASINTIDSPFRKINLGSDFQAVS